MPSEPATAIPDIISRLEALGAELAGHGWRVRTVAPAGRAPCLHVANPEPGASALAEDIYAAPRDGTWWFWWSWAEPIAADPVGAAAVIVRVLRSAKAASHEK
jgi:hypothetical protein